MKGERVLVVDDNPVNLKLARLVLESAGYAVATATDAREGLEAARAFAPRVVLADIQLPGMDGLEMARRLKADPATRGIVVLALTAYAMKGDEEKARLSGCDGYITKPIDTRSLAAQVAAYVGDGGRPQPAEVLVVDDDALTRSFLRLTLEGARYRVREATTGGEALAAIAERPPDLVVTSLGLPDREGRVLLAEIRAASAEAPIPVFALGPRAGEPREDAPGFDELLERPVGPARLLLEVGARLATKGSASQTRLTGRRVLLVDDDALALKLAKALLEHAGCRVDATTDPEEALARALRDPPDAVLSDVLMPRLDGFELCRAIRQAPGLAAVPVVLTSASYVEEEDRTLARGVGANALVMKSPDMADALRSLEEAIRAGPATADLAEVAKIEHLHRERLVRQLDLQMQEQARSAQREIRQATTLSLLSGICEALAQRAEAEPILARVLGSTLAGLGLSAGLILALEESGVLRPQAIAGIGPETGSALAELLGRHDEVRRAVETGEPVALDPRSAPEAFSHLPEALRDLRLVVVPLVARGQATGVLVVTSDASLLADPAWVAFSRTVSVQLGEAMALEEAMTALRSSERTYLTLFEGAAEGIFQATPSGRFLAVNPAFARSLGYGSAEELVAAVDDLGSQLFADPGRYLELLRRLGESGEITGFEVEMRRRDGSPVWLRLGARAVPDERGELVRLEAIAEDVTERRAAEEALRRHEQRLESVLAASPAVIYALSIAPGRAPSAAWIAPNVSGMTGYSVEEAMAAGWWPSRVHPDDLAAATRAAESVLDSGHGLHEYRFRHKSGPYRWVRDEMRLVRAPDGTPAEIVGSWTDVTDRRTAEEALRQSEESYRALFDASPQPMWVYDPADLRIVAVNDAALQAYGYTRPEMLTMTLWDVRSAEGHAELARALRETPPGRHHAGVFQHRRKDGSRLMVDVYSSSVLQGGRPRRLVLLRDVTELRRLEEQVRQAQKLDAMGRLAGGVAHDFNNLLTVINGYAEGLLEELPPGDPRTDDLREIRKAGDRAAALTRQLLAFSRKQLFHRRPLDLNAVVVGLQGMVARVVGEDVELTYDLDESLPLVLADRSQMEQVVLNLVVNARDAMPHGGALLVQTRAAAADGSVVPGTATHVRLTVRDTGVGMDPATMAQVFEPFFTTKAPGRGTGLGLSTVHGIVHQSGGEVRVSSEPGAGTSFEVLLPATLEVAEPPASKAASPARADRTASETVLLVEDEEALRRLARSVLASEGYAVLEASRPSEALRALGDHGGPIHVLVTDVVMPEMDGGALAQLVVARRPEIRVVFISGYSNEARALGEGLARPPTFLAKPFEPEELRAAVRGVLGS